MTGMKVGMMICCTIMVIPIIGYLVAGGSFALGGGSLSAAVPLVACLAVHGLMFVVMGKSCHGDKTETKPSSIPVVRPQAKRPSQGIAPQHDLNVGS